MTEFYDKANEERREQLQGRLDKKSPSELFDEIAKPIDPFRGRVEGEGLDEYKLLEMEYYRDILATRWGDYLSSIEKDMQARFRFGNMEDVVNATNQAVYNIPEEMVHYDLYSLEAYAGMNDMLDLKERITVNDVAISEFLETRAFRQAGESAEFLTGEVNNSLRTAVHDAMQAKITLPEFTLQDFIEYTSPYMDETRAMRIARTETTRAVNQATNDLARAMEAANYQPVEIWIIKQSTTVCPDCEALNGKIRGDGWTEYPPLHVNCDCDVFIKLRDQEGNLV